MLIGYLTLDEVNLALANELAEKCGAVLFALSPTDAVPNGTFDALVYDLDHLPAERRKQIVAELLTGTARSPLAVHSYNLCEEETETLRKRGVVVSRRVGPGLFAKLLPGKPGGKTGVSPHAAGRHP